MRIAIDARLNAYRRGGIPQYTRQLLTALSEIATEEQFISLQHRDMLRPLAVALNVTRRTVYTPPHHRFERWTLPFEVALVRPDVLHFPDFIAPTFRPCPAVVTIHDLAFMHYPQILDDAARAFYQQVLTNAHRADAVIAVSEATRQDIVQFLDVPVDDVKVIYEAAAPLFRRMELRPGEARVLNGKPVAAGTFMLFVSTLEPRKNLPTLLQALRICLDRDPARPYKLVIVGGRGWNDGPIFEAIRDLQLADHVLLAGSVGQYDLRWLYNACQFYINPSLYEGFGLPLLEAMTCGAACLAAATSSLPEIAGDAALYVPPLEPDQWADAMEALWDDTERQAELGRIGQARAQRFSWARAARETLRLYYHAAEKHGKPVAPRAPAPTSARRTAQPPQAAVVLPSATDLAGAERTCLRCRTPMLPGELQQHLRIQLAGEDGSEMPVQPRAWACPNCGYAELVVEPMVVPFADAVAAVPDEMEDRAEAFSHAETAAVRDGAYAAVADDEIAFDRGAGEQSGVPEARFAEAAPTVDAGGDDAEAVDEQEPVMHDEVAAEEVVSHDAVDTAHEDVNQPVMTEEDAPALPSDENHMAAQEPVADQPVSRETLVLPALDHDEAPEPPPSEAVSQASEITSDEPVSCDTMVLPARERDKEDAHEATGHAPRDTDEEQAVYVQEPVETDTLAEANMPAIEASVVPSLNPQPEAAANIEPPQMEIAEAERAVEPEAAVERHARANELLIANGDAATGTCDLTPIAHEHINGALNDHVASNGRRDARTADAPKQWQGKRSTASAKISRAAHKHSANSSAADAPGADMPRSKSRSQRKK